MITFILVRHGETVYNQTRRFTGHSDIDLAPYGKWQAERTADYIASQYTVDVIYSSDLKRACDTAAPLAERLGLSVIPERGLRETNVGEWQDLFWEEIVERYPDRMEEYHQRPAEFRFPGGECSHDVKMRAMCAIKRIAEKNDGKTVALFSHRGVISTLCRAFLQGASDGSINMPAITNTSVTVIRYDRETGNAELLQAAYTGHLTESPEAMTSEKIL